MPITVSRPLRYGMCALCMSMLHSLFTSFYVDYFVRRRLVQGGPSSSVGLHSSSLVPGGKETDLDRAGSSASNSTSSGSSWPPAANMDPSRAPVTGTSSDNRALLYFIIGQVGYAVWNGLNDLGFGWLGDTRFSEATRRRFQRLCYGGPLWAAAFALLWLPIDLPFLHPAVQFTLIMVIYDGFFSYASVSFRALLCDITTDAAEREQCNSTAAVFHVLGSVGVGFASYLYESFTEGQGLGSLTAFRVFMTVWALIAGIGFYFTSVGVQEVSLVGPSTWGSTGGGGGTIHRISGGTGGAGSTLMGRHVEAHSIPAVRQFSHFVRQTTRRTSLRVILFVWAVQDYSCTFATNFFGLFLAIVCGESVSLPLRSALLVLSFAVPHGITLLVTPFYRVVGKKRVAAIFFGLRGAVGCLGVLLAWRMRAAASRGTLAKASGGVTRTVEPLMVAGLLRAESTFCVLLFLNRVLTEAVCRMQGLILSDVTDEDTVLFARQLSMAAALNGFVSLVSKPFQSAAPVVTCLFLAHVGVSAPRNPEEMSGVTMASSAQAAAIVLFFSVNSALTSLVMLAAWQRWYDLDGKHLQFIQQAIRKRTKEGMYVV